jgi:hypothetical protein
LLQEHASLLLYTYIACPFKIDSWRNVVFEGLLNVLIINEILGLLTVRILPIFEAIQTKAGIWRSSECTGLKLHAVDKALYVQRFHNNQKKQDGKN